jgi:diguanylate cyclase (GGDEF)-like protein
LTGQADTLVVGDGPGRREITRHAPRGTYTCIPDPYSGVQAMSQRAWGAVVATADRATLPGLARAARRLQPDASLFALCHPRDESATRPLVGDTLDDYFIAPPTRADVSRILSAAAGTSLEPRHDQLTLPAHALKQLLAAARGIGSLEKQLAQQVAGEVGTMVEWREPNRANPEQVLLELPAVNDHPGRVLVSTSDTVRPRDPRRLAALQEILPQLVTLAGRGEALHRLAVTDHLTGAYNRRYFYHITDQILSRVERSGSRAAVLLYDIDDFKRYNDTYGHAAGDEVLRDTAELMRQVTREQDVVARIGGDEFAVLFWDVDTPRVAGSEMPDTAEVLANRFLRAVRLHEFRSLGPEATGTLTVSGGLARFREDGTTCRELLRSADAALKQAKGSGKATICLIGVDSHKQG